MPSLSHDHLELESCSHVPETYRWPPSHRHDYPTTSTANIPVVDISLPEAASLIDSACRSWGVFYVTSHGIPSHLLQAAETQTHRLFSLPLHRKLLASRRPGSISGFGRPPLSAFFPKLMWSEGFTLAGNPLNEVASTLWPEPDHDHDSRSHFCELMDDYKKSMRDLARKLLRLTLASIGGHGDGEERVGWIGLKDQMIEALQLNSYPPCPEPEKAIGMATHTDSGFLTILHQSGNMEGLQVLQPNDGSDPFQWVPIRPMAGALVVHVGDLLQILSNGRFKSVRHRAVVSQSEHRVSMAYFYGPPSDVKVGPMVLPGQCPIYRPTTWPEYLEIRARLFDGSLESIKISHT
ncbi:hypothetical protein HPP92_000596 [Vanilla planifolia]|uniref:Fe2OG dioxygenase domain-containing protein n=1 Tax=Vanilla planifolia TaxID=51239 RepID=A0A835RYE0_VANPL|nr:hypothetical protein HPP92_000596 [Vanilla planifolia]